MLAQTAAFIVIWILLRRRVSRRGPIPSASSFCKFHNRSYSAASLLLLLLVLSPDHDSVARRAYHYSKFYEYLDILSVCAAGGQINLHFGFHHLTTSYLTFFRVVNENEPGRGWVVFAASNTFHHVLMYAYFGGVAFIKPVLPWTGGLQLLNGILTELALLREKQLRGTGIAETKWPLVSDTLYARPDAKGTIKGEEERDIDDEADPEFRGTYSRLIWFDLVWLLDNYFVLCGLT
jgi:hypothetical protein